ncbi:urease accessory protein UreF [Patulibacter defluvii]|uniref:urease accessory protein UreF n=1 Tax=Patulibacter defluvii TaxID=3095358 RepID=UPI002A74C763|nr:urease accessory UreF family protein [Patulibacter sp. DM4]
MPTLLRLLQLADSAFPTGAFAHSLGLEGVHAAGELRDEADLERLLRRQLDGLATSDLPVALAAHRLAAPAATNRTLSDRKLTAGAAAAPLELLIDLDHELDATRATRETRQASRATGERFLLAAAALLDDPPLRALRAAVDDRATPGTLPVAWALAARAVGADAAPAAEALAFSALAALAEAGQRLVPLGGVATQRALWAAAAAIPAAVAAAAAHDPREPCSFVPELDVRSAEHERQRVRLFIS